MAFSVKFPTRQSGELFSPTRELVKAEQGVFREGITLRFRQKKKKDRPAGRRPAAETKARRLPLQSRLAAYHRGRRDDVPGPGSLAGSGRYNDWTVISWRGPLRLPPCRPAMTVMSVTFKLFLRQVIKRVRGLGCPLALA
jgi:hypothetical protein